MNTTRVNWARPLVPEPDFVASAEALAAITSFLTAAAALRADPPTRVITALEGGVPTGIRVGDDFAIHRSPDKLTGAYKWTAEEFEPNTSRTYKRRFMGTAAMVEYALDKMLFDIAPDIEDQVVAEFRAHADSPLFPDPGSAEVAIANAFAARIDQAGTPPEAAGPSVGPF
jgi:hypothetical protein